MLGNGRLHGHTNDQLTVFLIGVIKGPLKECVWVDVSFLVTESQLIYCTTKSGIGYKHFTRKREFFSHGRLKVRMAKLAAYMNIP